MDGGLRVFVVYCRDKEGMSSSLGLGLSGLISLFFRVVFLLVMSE